MDIEISAKKFFDFETKNKLFLKKINNLSYWDYIRYPTFIEILNHFKGKNKSYIYNQSQNSKFSNTLNNLLSLFYHSLKFLIKILRIILAKNKYDLIFLDADKKNYLKYLNLIIPLLRKKGVLVSDNVLWSGKVINANDNKDLETTVLKKFNHQLSNHKNLETVLLPIRDGISLSMKI